jgi:peroxiredoxin
MLLGIVLLASADQAATALEQTLTPLPDKPPAPAFDLAGPDGRRWRLADLQGKPMIINFWATWCPPCRAEMPSMQRAWEMVADEGILIIAINVGEDVGTVKRFLAQQQVPMRFPLPIDGDAEVTQSWPLKGLPTTFVVDPSGRIVYKATGEREWDDPALLDLVRALKQRPPHGADDGTATPVDDVE